MATSDLEEFCTRLGDAMRRANVRLWVKAAEPRLHVGSLTDEDVDSIATQLLTLSRKGGTANSFKFSEKLQLGGDRSIELMGRYRTWREAQRVPGSLFERPPQREEIWIDHAAVELFAEEVPSTDPLTESDIELLVDELPLDREVELRRWLEPLHGQLVVELAEGRIQDPLARRRLEQDTEYMAAQLFETELGDLRAALVIQLALSVVEALAPVVDEPGAELAGRLAGIPKTESYSPSDVIKQRDAVADATGLKKDEVDRGLLTFDHAIGLLASVSTIYGALSGGAPGVLLGAAVAIIWVSVKVTRGGWRRS